MEAERVKNRRAQGWAYERASGKRKRAAAQRRLARAAAGTRSTVRCWYAGQCAECGSSFVDLQPERVTCSRKCLDRRGRKAYRAKHGRMDNHRKRARVLGVAYEPISKSVVFERDNWTCGICGLPVDQALPATHERGPTLDHVIALAELGPHTYDNVQCAHRDCNWRKGRTDGRHLRMAAA